MGFGESEKNIYAYDILTFNDVTWGVITRIQKSEIFAPIMASQYQVWGVTLIVLIIIALISVAISRSISKPLSRQVEAMEPLSEGNYAVEIPDQNRGDEIGDIARAVQTFKENGLRMKEMEAEQEMQKAAAEREKREAQIRLANQFDSRVGGVITKLSDSAESMTSVAQQMQSASQQTAELSGTVASSATEADSNVQTVAAAAEELSASSAEIARQIDAVAKKASSAADDAQVTSSSVKELNVLADSIGEVIGTIKDIAEQTNLLALNATIEAARAGEAGKGFAVVADEVKKLANETSSKTIEIDERVNRIQEAIRNSVTAMDKIISNVSEIDAATTTVASAVEEQNAATAEIGRNVSEASTGTQQVSSSIMQVQQNASESGEASNSVLQSATDLKSQSDILKEEVKKFLNEIRGGAEQQKSPAAANDKTNAAGDQEAAE
jgi:methyl-accepting chemotaxis protein